MLNTKTAMTPRRKTKQFAILSVRFFKLNIRHTFLPKDFRNNWIGLFAIFPFVVFVTIHAVVSITNKSARIKVI